MKKIFKFIVLTICCILSLNIFAGCNLNTLYETDIRDNELHNIPSEIDNYNKCITIFDDAIIDNGILYDYTSLVNKNLRKYNINVDCSYLKVARIVDESIYVFANYKSDYKNRLISYSVSKINIKTRKTKLIKLFRNIEMGENSENVFRICHIDKNKIVFKSSKKIFALDLKTTKVDEIFNGDHIKQFKNIVLFLDRINSVYAVIDINNNDIKTYTHSVDNITRHCIKIQNDIVYFFEPNFYAYNYKTNEPVNVADVEKCYEQLNENQFDDNIMLGTYLIKEINSNEQSGSESIEITDTKNNISKTISIDYLKNNNVTYKKICEICEADAYLNMRMFNDELYLVCRNRKIQLMSYIENVPCTLFKYNFEDNSVKFCGIIEHHDGDGLSNIIIKD